MLRNFSERIDKLGAVEKCDENEVELNEENEMLAYLSFLNTLVTLLRTSP